MNIGRTISVQRFRAITSRSCELNSWQIRFVSKKLSRCWTCKHVLTAAIMETFLYSPGPGKGTSADSVMGWASRGPEATSSRAQQWRWEHIMTSGCWCWMWLWFLQELLKWKEGLYMLRRSPPVYILPVAPHACHITDTHTHTHILSSSHQQYPQSHPF